VEYSELSNVSANFASAIFLASVSERIWVGWEQNATIFWSIVRPHILYSASTPTPLTKYSFLHNGMSS
jgi:hypothetical protein